MSDIAKLEQQLDALDEFRFINLESDMDVLADMLRSDGLLAAEREENVAQNEQEDPFSGLFSQEGN